MDEFEEMILLYNTILNMLFIMGAILFVLLIIYIRKQNVIYTAKYLKRMKQNKRKEGHKLVTEHSIKITSILIITIIIMANHASIYASEKKGDVAKPALTLSSSISGQNTDIFLNIAGDKINFKNTDIDITVKDIEGTQKNGDIIMNGKSYKSDGIIDILKKSNFYEKTKTGYRIHFQLKGDGIYIISGYVINENGKKSDGVYGRYVIDNSRPQCTISNVQTVNGSKLTKSPINDKKYFSNGPMEVSLKSSDNISGIKYVILKAVADSKVYFEKKISIKSGYRNDEIEQLILVDLKDTFFDGEIYAYAVDNNENKSVNTILPIAVEPKEIHNNRAYISTKIMNAPNKNGFFNDEVSVNSEVYDPFSGIGIINYTVENGSTYKSEKKFYGDCGTHKFWSGTLKIAPSNKIGDVVFVIEGTDKAGNGITGQTGKLKIDSNRPVAEIKINDDNPEHIFKREVECVINIKELNFDPSRTKVSIYKDDIQINTQVSFKKTGNMINDKTGDYYVYSSRIRLEDDGVYKIKVNATDLADNQGAECILNNIVIDRKEPKIKFRGVSQNKYYNSNKIMKIVVTEKNFEVKNTKVQIWENGIEKNIGNNIVWTSRKDVHTGEIKLENDQTVYDVKCSSTDSAGNNSVTNRVSGITIDKIKPHIMISSPKTAYSENVEVSVKIEDKYPLIESSIFLTRNKKIIKKIIINKCEKSNNRYITDISLDKSLFNEDGHYRIQISAKDGAGNINKIPDYFIGGKKKADGTIIVSQKGSEFINENTLTEFYNLETNVPDLQIVEENYAYLKSNGIISIYRNGNLADSVSYTCKCIGIINEKYRYIYNVNANNFVKDGIYEIVIASKDCVGNVNRYDQIKFCVDTTKPEIYISGLVNGGVYKQNSKTVIMNAVKKYDSEYNEYEVFVDGTKCKKVQDNVWETEIGECVNANVKILVQDKAGNAKEYNYKDITISSSWIYRNKKIIYISIASLVMGIIAMAIIIKKRH